MSSSNPHHHLPTPAHSAPTKKSGFGFFVKIYVLRSLKLVLYDLYFRRYSFMIIVLTYGLYDEILYSVLMITRMVLVWDFIFLLPPPPPPRHTSPNCIHHSKTHAIGHAPEHNWALNNPGFHPISSEPPLSNTICKGMHYRMAKVERILPTFTLLSLHFKRQIWIPVKTFSHVMK